MAHKDLYHMIQSIVVDTVNGEVKPMTVQPATLNEDGTFRLDQQLDVNVEIPERYGAGAKVAVSGHLTMQTTGTVPGTVDAEIEGELVMRHALEPGDTVLVTKRPGQNRYYLTDKMEAGE